MRNLREQTQADPAATMRPDEAGDLDHYRREARVLRARAMRDLVIALRAALGRQVQLMRALPLAIRRGHA